MIIRVDTAFAKPDSSQVEQLSSLYEGAGANVTLHWDAGGHQITLPEVDAARTWLNGLHR